MKENCPCESGKHYNDCCGAIISNQRKANTAEELMRARYTAFTSANVDFLLRTHQKKSRPNKQKNKIKRWANSVEWIGLAISKTIGGMEYDNDGYVEFRAIFIENNQYEHIHENSYFLKEDDEWFYAGGTNLDLLREEQTFL